MTAHAPISGTFPHFAARWVDPALGFAVGWNYFYVSGNEIAVSEFVDLTNVFEVERRYGTCRSHRCSDSLNILGL